MPVPEESCDQADKVSHNFENHHASATNDDSNCCYTGYAGGMPQDMLPISTEYSNVYLIHVHPGATFSIQMQDGTYQNFTGPTNVPMISTNGIVPPIVSPPNCIPRVFEGNGVKHVLFEPSNGPAILEPHASYLNTQTMYQHQSSIPLPNLPHSQLPTELFPQIMISPTCPTDSTYYHHTQVQYQEEPRNTGELSDSTYGSMHQHSQSTSPLSEVPSISTHSYLQDSVEWHQPIRERSTPSTSSPVTSSPVRSSSSSTSASSMTSSPRNSPKSNQRSLHVNGHKGPRSPICHSVKGRQSNPHHSQPPSTLTTNERSRHSPIPSERIVLAGDAVQLSDADKDMPAIVLDQTLTSEPQQLGTIYEYLKTINKPEVKEVDTTSAIIVWQSMPLDNISEQLKETIQNQSIEYELQLALSQSKKNLEGKFQFKYRGHFLKYEIQDLRPGSEYFVRLFAACDNISGPPSEITSFRTLSTKPDTPSPPKLAQRHKNYLQLKWQAPNDNGEKIHCYHLEFDKADNRSGFNIIHQNSSKQSKVTRLLPSHGYVFRLAAENKIGKSDWSREVVLYTSGVAPTTPDPPQLVNATSKTIELSWSEPADSYEPPEYTLLKEDESNLYGFQVVYNGPDLRFTVKNLVRSSRYKFKLQASNSTGKSNFSKVVAFTTTAERPKAPGKPHLKGNKHPRSLTLQWNASGDDGGAIIDGYRLEMAKNKNDKMKEIYTGKEKQYTVTGLEPGHSYRFHVLCFTSTASSLASEETILSTNSVAPGQCPCPVLAFRPKASCISIKWDPPSNTGGADIVLYEVNHASDDSTDDLKLDYSGPAREFTIFNLLPGSKYSFSVRASNRIGFGPWSDRLEVVTGAGCPDKPVVFEANVQSSSCINLQWEAPKDNGATINSYKIQWGPAQEAMHSYITRGPQLHYKFDSLSPFTTYYFNISAISSAGTGLPSDFGTATTLPGCPDQVPNLRLGVPECDNADEVDLDDTLISSNHLSVIWNIPKDNGSDITSYKVFIALDYPNFSKEVDIDPNVTHYKALDLDPDTKYSLKVCAYNDIGAGPCSSILVIRTKPLPPDPPILHCTQKTYNSIKLEWTQLSKASSGTEFLLQLRDKNGRFSTLYRGPNLSYRLTRLSEETVYKFRISAMNLVGASPFSDEIKFETEIQPPNAIESPIIRNVRATECEVFWTKLNKMKGDSVNYRIMLEKVGVNQRPIDLDCEGTAYSLRELTPDTKYRLRVMAIRCHSFFSDDSSSHSQQNESFKEIPGSPSPIVSFMTKHGISNNTRIPKLYPLNQATTKEKSIFNTVVPKQKEFPSVVESIQNRPSSSVFSLTKETRSAIQSIIKHFLCAIIAAFLLWYFCI